MTRPDVLIFHRPAAADAPPLVRLLAEVRMQLAERHSALFAQAAAGAIRIETGWPPGASFGEALSALAPTSGGVIVMGSGAVPLLKARDARRLIAVATGGGGRALTNNRYSSDVCAIGDASVLRQIPPLPSDNALPRWLEEHRGFAVDEMPGRTRLALDLDSPADVALAGLAPAGGWLRKIAERNGLEVPNRTTLQELSRDPLRELLVFGRSGSRTLRWLERNVRCRVRFLAEERGLRAASPLAIAATAAADPMTSRRPSSTLGMLLDQRGPEALSGIVAGLADGAILDSRVLMAGRFGADEDAWPSPADRFASDLLRSTEVADPWLRALTAAADSSSVPILLGGHTIVGPGIRLLLSGAEGTTGG